MSIRLLDKSPCSFSMPAWLPGQPHAWLAAKGDGPHLRGGADALGVEPLRALVALHPVAGRAGVVRLLAQAVQLRGRRRVLLLNLPLLLHRPLSAWLLRDSQAWLSSLPLLNLLRSAARCTIHFWRYGNSGMHPCNVQTACRSQHLAVAFRFTPICPPASGKTGMSCM